MAIRDQFRVDTVLRQAARIQGLDAELGSIDRMMRMEDAGAAGTCPSCGSLYARGAVYCWRCGHDLIQRSAPDGGAPVAPAPAQQQPPDAQVGAAAEGTKLPGQA